jgi:hypothetical protein
MPNRSKKAGHQAPTSPVPGGKGQRSKSLTVPGPRGNSSTKGGTGKGRGVLGSGYAYKDGRLPSSVKAAGNFGGGFAYTDGRRPPNADRRG